MIAQARGFHMAVSGKVPFIHPTGSKYPVRLGGLGTPNPLPNHLQMGLEHKDIYIYIHNIFDYIYIYIHNIFDYIYIYIYTCNLYNSTHRIHVWYIYPQLP